MSLYNTPKNKKSQQNKGQDKGMAGLFPFWKKPGETLAVMLRRFRDEHSLGPEEKLTYAGRLDPMAEGIVPVLAGEDRFQKDMLLNRSKTYEVEILLGIGTDTGDMMGLTTSDPSLNGVKSNFELAEIQKAIAVLAQTVSMPYPNYSSRPVDGKPLFMHARASNKVILPIKKVTIHDLELLSIEQRTIGDLVANVIETIEKVQGDFRQQEIIEQWNEMQKEYSEEKVKVVTIRTTVSSGTYMRALAEKLGILLKVPALAYYIKRVGIEGMK